LINFKKKGLTMKGLVDPKLLEGVKDLIFPVAKIPLEDLNFPYDVVQGKSNAIVVKGNKVINFCSPDYGLRTNESLIKEFLEHLVSNGYKPKKLAGFNFNNRRFRIDIELDLASYNMGSKGINDLVSMGIRVYNSYDGSQKFMFQVGLYRLVCLNGMTTLVEDLSIKKSHTTQVLDGVDISESLDLLDAHKEGFDEMVQVYHDLKDFRLKDPEVRLENVAENTGFPMGLLEGARERMILELRRGYPPSDWVVYNALNYMLNHGNDSFIGRKFERLDREILNYML
jgi:hypothetical protein